MTASLTATYEWCCDLGKAESEVVHSIWKFCDIFHIVVLVARSGYNYKISRVYLSINNGLAMNLSRVCSVAYWLFFHLGQITHGLWHFIGCSINYRRIPPQQPHWSARDKLGNLLVLLYQIAALMIHIFITVFFSLIIYLLGDVGSFSQCRLDAMYFFWLAVSKCVCVCVPCLRRGILITLRETSNPRIFYSVRHRQSSPVVLRTSKAHLDIQMVNIASSAEAKSLVRQVQQSESFVDQHPELRPVRFPGHWVCSRLCRSTSLSQLKISELAAIERCVQ